MEMENAIGLMVEETHKAIKELSDKETIEDLIMKKVAERQRRGGGDVLSESYRNKKKILFNSQSKKIAPTPPALTAIQEEGKPELELKKLQKRTTIFDKFDAIHRKQNQKLLSIVEDEALRQKKLQEVRANQTTPGRLLQPLSAWTTKPTSLEFGDSKKQAVIDKDGKKVYVKATSLQRQQSVRAKATTSLPPQSKKENQNSNNLKTAQKAPLVDKKLPLKRKQNTEKEQPKRRKREPVAEGEVATKVNQKRKKEEKTVATAKVNTNKIEKEKKRKRASPLSANAFVPRFTLTSGTTLGFSVGNSKKKVRLDRSKQQNKKQVEAKKTQKQSNLKQTLASKTPVR